MLRRVDPSQPDRALQLHAETQIQRHRQRVPVDDAPQHGRKGTLQPCCSVCFT